MNSPEEFLRCPRCGGKTRIRVRPGTVLKDFPLFCPKCRYECVIARQGGRSADLKPGKLRLCAGEWGKHGEKSYDRGLRAGLRKM